MSEQALKTQLAKLETELKGEHRRHASRVMNLETQIQSLRYTLSVMGASRIYQQTLFDLANNGNGHTNRVEELIAAG